MQERIAILRSVLLDILDYPSGNTNSNRIIWNIFSDNRACTYDTILANRNTGHNCCIQSDMTVVTDSNSAKLVNIIQAGVKMTQHPYTTIMSRKVDPSCDSNVISNLDKVWLRPKKISV